MSTPAQTGTWGTSRDMGYLHPYQGDDHFRRVGVHGYVTLLDKDWDNLFKCRCEFQSNTKGSLVYDICCNKISVKGALGVGGGGEEWLKTYTVVRTGDGAVL